jgi:predicted short-subunit dehydrogenase-like oxidoreductase (DUF2520 family)
MSHLATPDRTRLALVGAGRVGTAVASLLRNAGHEVVGVVSRSDASARSAARHLGAPTFARLNDLPPADLVLIGATESAIEEVARAVALNVVPGTVVVHFAGTFGLAPLRNAIANGARGAALHPVQAMPSVEQALARLPGSAWGVTCPPDLRAWAHSLIQADLRGEPIDVREEDRPLWHAASVTTSNGLAALLYAGERMLDAIGVERPESVLGPLVSGTLANALQGGGGGATLTGPAVRGERPTVDRHLHALRDRAPELAASYRLAARLVLEGAEAAGRVAPDDAQEMWALLEDV